MKEMLQFTARYNADANSHMIEVLKTVPEDSLKKDIGIYYGSVLGTFEHILAGDIAIFGSVYKNYCKNPDKFCDPVLQMGSFKDGLNAEVTKSLDTLFDTRKKVDEIILQMIDDMDDLSKVEELQFPGITFKKPRYQMVVSMLTHSTHHRGQIAAALDIMGITNDFAGMLGTE